MLKKIYLAECSNTYRHLLTEWLKPYTEELVDLWDQPAASIQENLPNQLLIIDETFLAKGPGPARSTLTSLVMEGKITSLPLLVLERREKLIPFKINSRALKLRRPFYSKDFDSIFETLGIKPYFPEKEVRMNEEYVSEKIETANLTPMIEQAIAQALNNANLPEKTQEALEKAICEIVPALAEKMIKEEIERLTK